MRQCPETGLDRNLPVYTQEEFERMAQGGFLAHVLETGQVIYEKDAA